jgi:hypothetical protein
MSIINITRIRNARNVILAPTEEQIRSATIKELPIEEGTLIRFREDEYGFPAIEETLDHKTLLAFLLKHHTEHNVIFGSDDSIIVQYTEKGRPTWTGHALLITHQPHKLTVLPNITWELEWMFGYPLKSFLDECIAERQELRV